MGAKEGGCSCAVLVGVQHCTFTSLCRRWCTVTQVPALGAGAQEDEESQPGDADVGTPKSSSSHLSALTATSSGAEAWDEGACDGARAAGLLPSGKASASLLGEQGGEGRGQSGLSLKDGGISSSFRAEKERAGHREGQEIPLSPRPGQAGQESAARAKGKAPAAATTPGKAPKMTVTVPEAAGTKEGAPLLSPGLSPRGKTKTPATPKAGRPAPLSLGKPAASTGTGKGQ